MACFPLIHRELLLLLA